MLGDRMLINYELMYACICRIHADSPQADSDALVLSLLTCRYGPVSHPPPQWSAGASHYQAAALHHVL